MVSAAPVGNEPVSDEELRPHILEGFIGQPRLKAQLQLFLDAARKRDVPPDHILLAGPPGLGKTTLAMYCGQMNWKFQSASLPVPPSNMLVIWLRF